MNLGRDRLAGRVAIVTGAARGIGAGIVATFVQQGAHVIGIDVLETELKETCASLGAHAFPFDITNAEAWQACVQQTRTRFGGVDILVNNAAVSPYAHIAHDTDAAWQRVMDVNLGAVRLGCKASLEALRQSNHARIINVGSAQAIATEGRLGAYTASKGALHAFTRSLAVDLAPDGILVNAIAPGCIHTPLSIVDGVDETTTADFAQWYVGKRKIPLARPGTAGEVAAVALFLASDDCSYVTGHTLVADGGLTITF